MLRGCNGGRESPLPRSCRAKSRHVDANVRRLRSGRTEKFAHRRAAWHRPVMHLEDRILFIDGDAIVIDKPAGLPVDAPRLGGDCIEYRIQELMLGFKRPPT